MYQRCVAFNESGKCSFAQKNTIILAVDFLLCNYCHYPNNRIHYHFYPLPKITWMNDHHTGLKIPKIEAELGYWDQFGINMKI